jgi:hypothetical protein
MFDFRKIPNGVLLSPEDSRDYTINKFKVAAAFQLPNEYTIPYVPDVQNQYFSSMCVAFSLAGLKQSQEWKERGIKKRYSPAFIYANREITDWQGEGMYPREALKRLKYGTCEFSDFDIVDSYPICKAILNQRINQLLPLALPQKTYAYAKLRNTQEIKQCLYEFKTPVLVCIDVYDSFYNTGKDGIVSSPSGNNNGGHAMIAVSWVKKNGKEYMGVLNSWGKDFGDSGVIYIDNDTYKFTECWTVVDQNPQQELNKATEILLTIGNKKMIVDGKIIEMDTAPFYNKDNRTFVPVRFISEALGMTVKWYDCGSVDGNGDMILITNGGERTLDELKELIGSV